MKKNILIPIIASVFLFGLLAMSPALAAEEKETEGNGVQTAIELLTLVVVGGIIYNVVIGSSGFGGQIGQSLKVISLGVGVLSLQTLDDVIEGITDVGSETLLGDGVLHDSAHHIIILVGFFIVALGLSKLTKVVKGLKA